MIDNLLKEIYAHGDRGAVVPFSRVDDLKKDMLDLKNGDYHPSWLDRMVKHTTDETNKFIPHDITFEPHSIISIIMPSPKVILQFSYNGKITDCIVPPHYMDWNSKNDRVLQYLSSYLSPLGYSVAAAVTIPQKLLAAHCGLARYGRNNICYSEEFGSYMQIMTYLSDMPCDDHKWFSVERMEICNSCNSCVISCPTNAIDSHRSLINSDRCITFYDELPDIEFPEWLSTDAHNSIVGCIKCQDCCPVNAHNKSNFIVGATFTEEETKELLSKKSNELYSDSLAVKLEKTGIPPEYSNPSVLPRNLAVLLLK